MLFEDAAGGESCVEGSHVTCSLVCMRVSRYELIFTIVYFSYTEYLLHVLPKLGLYSLVYFLLL